MMCDTFLLAPHKNYVSPQQVIFNAGDTPIQILRQNTLSLEAILTLLKTPKL
jgi:hypothetical protein